MMKALRKVGPRLEVCCLPVPSPAPGDVLVRVAVAGLCRTDVYVARGTLPAADPVVLGHEFSGTVAALGAGVTRLHAGQRVAVLPLLPCQRCALCAEGDTINCPERLMLGIDRDGAFAQYVTVPAALVYPVPECLSFHQAAYAEPVAAALGVLQAGIQPRQRGLVLGSNRFSALLQRVLRAHGFDDVTVSGPSPEEGQYDFVVETGIGPDTLATMVRAARPRGTLVLRSRQPGPVAVDLLAAVSRQLTLRAVNYGSFRQALGLLVEGALDLDGLLGPAFALEAHAEVFARAEASESSKLFFDPWGD
jgi:L-iditol 2-dehydrogenase